MIPYQGEGDSVTIRLWTGPKGRLRALLRCESCGASQWVYLWSWAGHGRAICQQCKGVWDYRDRYRILAQLAEVGA